ncbi:ATPase [Sphingobium chlorophenolicum]|uniref:ATPase n=1 Tax=Sphingobium chlorophenolicum TaxID=46429 RepID=A0A081R8D7_SPHCR|nr:ATPase [Sphingobium chlorophenolicum]
MSSPIERLAELVIGTVESISTDEIRVLLDLDAPQSTALNTGTPTSFPRLNSYVLIPNEAGATVAYVTWIGIERSPYPKRSGLKDFGLIDLPFPLRKMTLSPIGTLTVRRDRRAGRSVYELSRGVVAFPSVGDQILIPTPEQIAAIVGAKDTDRRVRIGSSPLAANTSIMVDPDKIFGRHVAVLGNTGSGKSCSVAGLIRWSLVAAQSALKGGAQVPNARFIILDPNGEYARAFADQKDYVRLFRVPPVNAEVGERALRLPAWLWNGHEWTAVSYAKPGAQRPLLLQALRDLKTGNLEGVPPEVLVRRYVYSYRLLIDALLARGPAAFAGDAGPRRQCGELLDNISNDCDRLSQRLGVELQVALANIAASVRDVANNRRSNNGWFNAFSVEEIESVQTALQRFLDAVEDGLAAAQVTEDAPIPFDVDMLPDHLERIAATEGAGLAGFISTLGMRIRGMMADPRLGQVVGSEPALSLDAWLNDLVGSNASANGQVAIIDLSLVPSEIVHVVVAVLARLTFESLQRYRRLHPEGRPLPTTLVLEEAHSFVRRGFNDEGPAENPAQLCREIFEKIAREGRKFGLGLMLSSQRPSELSPTILAQCNTFLLHRIVNDLDQALVARLVPDNVAGLLKELPSLPSRQAVLLGWATPIPLLVEMDELAEEHRPQSSDPDFWDVWTGKSAREIDWLNVVQDWTGAP